MSPLKKSSVQLWVALFMIALWGVGLLVAVWDGDVMVKVMTPLMTVMLGWLFTDHATRAKDE